MKKADNEIDVLKDKLLEYETRINRIQSCVKASNSILIGNDEIVKILAEIEYYSDFNQFVHVG